MGTRLLIAAFVVTLGFGGYWVGRRIVNVGKENNLGAQQISVTTSAKAAHAARAHRHKIDREILEGLGGAGLAYVILPAIFSIPSRRWRRRRRSEATASRV